MEKISSGVDSLHFSSTEECILIGQMPDEMFLCYFVNVHGCSNDRMRYYRAILETVSDPVGETIQTEKESICVHWIS